MAWASTSKRRAELPPDWNARARACIKAAGGRCQRILPSGRRCPRAATDADHRGDPLDHDDLEALCGHHHKKKTQREAQAARNPAKPIRAREERHPGGRA